MICATFASVQAARALVAAAGTLLSIALSDIAPAGAQGTAPKARYGYVTAVSKFGNGSTSAQVRIGPWGTEVQLPRGKWIACFRTCSDTLRRQTIDFWESQIGTEGNENGRGKNRWPWPYNRL